jgi:LacI family transcriptional regulator
MVDNYRGAELAIAHLIDQGHTAIGMLAGISPSPDGVRRVKGYYDTLAANGLTANTDWVKPGPPTLARGREAAGYLLTQHPQITAIFAYNDLLALGAVRACCDLGRRVPDDCAIVGFDDTRFASMATPSLTSVSYDKYGLGQKAMARLLDMVVNESRIAYPPIEIEVELTIRESTSKPGSSISNPEIKR